VKWAMLTPAAPIPGAALGLPGGGAELLGAQGVILGRQAHGRHEGANETIRLGFVHRQGGEP
jgi:hypothetical protein